MQPGSENWISIRAVSIPPPDRSGRSRPRISSTHQRRSPASAPAHAIEGGLFEDDAGYDRALREVAIDLVRDELKRRSGAEAELLQTIEALDDLNEVINRLDERLYVWSRLYREDRLRGKDLAESLVGEDVIQMMGAEMVLFKRLKGKAPLMENSLGATPTKYSDKAPTHPTLQ